MRYRGWLFVVAAFLFCAFGAAAPAGVGGALAAEVKFGAALPLTGPLATEGKKQQAGYEIWRERVNKAGGINVGGKKMKVQIVYYDYESKTPTATKLAERLITKEKVDLLLGPFGSGATKSVAAITERYQVPLIAPVASSEPIFDQGYKYLFGLLAPNAYLPNNFFTLLKAQKPMPRTMAFVTRNDFFPRAITRMLRKAAKKHGFSDVYYAEFPKDSKDMSTWLTVVKGQKPRRAHGGRLSPGHPARHEAGERAGREAQNPVHHGGPGLRPVHGIARRCGEQHPDRRLVGARRSTTRAGSSARRGISGKSGAASSTRSRTTSPPRRPPRASSPRRRSRRPARSTRRRSARR